MLQTEGITTFNNGTNLCVVISLKPIKPKKKVRDLMIIRPFEFKVSEAFEVELSKLCFRFTTQEEVMGE